MSLAIIKPKERRITLHKFQGDAWNSKTRFTWMIAGTGGGKTWFEPYWARREIIKYPKDAGMLVAPNYRMLMRNVLYGTNTAPGFLRVNKDLIARRKDGSLKVNKNEGIIQLASGGMVYLGSADREGSLEGAHVRWAVLDELALMSRLAWIVMQARTGFLEGDVFGATTPWGMNWVKKEIYDPWAKGEDPDSTVVQFTSIDNPHYPIAEYERARRRMSPQMFNMRYRGQFERLEGLIWPELAGCVIGPFPIPKEWVKLAANDFGWFPNPTCILEAVRSPEHNYYVTKVSKKTKMGQGEIEKDLRATGAKRIWPDPSEKRLIEELRRKGVRIPSKRTENDVEYGLGKVTEMLKTGRLKIFKDTCVDLVDEAESYRRDENGKVVKKDDHACDALRYLIASEEGQSKRSPITIISMAKGED